MIFNVFRFLPQDLITDHLQAYTTGTLVLRVSKLVTFIILYLRMQSTVYKYADERRSRAESGLQCKFVTLELKVLLSSVNCGRIRNRIRGHLHTDICAAFHLKWSVNTAAQVDSDRKRTNMALPIGIDGTPLLGQRSGVGNYTGRLLAAMMETRPSWEFLLYSNKPIDSLEPALAHAKQIYNLSARKRLLWMHFMLPRIIQRSQPHLCHFPNAMAPMWFGKPFILTIHDASLFLHSEYHPLARILSIRLALPKLARRASAVITVSNHARDDLIRVLGLPQDKITVIYEAASREMRPETDPACLAGLRKKYNLPERYLLFVGTLDSRKNLVRLVRSYSQVRKMGFPHRLVISGSTGWKIERLYEEIEQLSLQDSVVLTGYVPDEDLPGLLSMSSLFVFPSLFEGFGLPPLEAMACGTPVLSSASTSMPEICGDAAYYVDPEDEDSISSGIATLLRDEEYRRDLGRRGLERSRMFSWERAARETLEVYQQVLNRSS
jgi:glycosyltransferase involved in cell wall biosynthesis